MSTLLDMRSRIADDINREDLNSQIDKAINRAIKHYQGEALWFKETHSTFVTQSGQQTYSSTYIPSDLSKITYLEAHIATVDEEVVRRTYPWIQQANASTTLVGPPSDYAQFNNSIILYPTPDASYTVTVSYLKSYEELTSDAATNDFLTYAEDLIEARAEWWIYSRVLKDYEAATMAKQEEGEALYALRLQSENFTLGSEPVPYSEF